MPGAADAQEQPQACAPRAQVIAKLADRFGETLRDLGYGRSGVVEVYRSDETGTWTILMSRPDGISCMIAEGRIWDADVRPLTKQGDPT
jgi:hypothetical protein